MNPLEGKLKIILNEKQLEYIVEKTQEKSKKRAFNMFLSAMQKEKIRPNKMPLLIDKMMAKDAERKE